MPFAAIGVMQRPWTMTLTPGRPAGATKKVDVPFGPINGAPSGVREPDMTK